MNKEVEILIIGAGQDFQRRLKQQNMVRKYS